MFPGSDIITGPNGAPALRVPEYAERVIKGAVGMRWFFQACRGGFAHQMSVRYVLLPWLTFRHHNHDERLGESAHQIRQVRSYHSTRRKRRVGEVRNNPPTIPTFRSVKSGNTHLPGHTSLLHEGAVRPFAGEALLHEFPGVNRIIRIYLDTGIDDHHGFKPRRAKSPVLPGSGNPSCSR